MEISTAFALLASAFLGTAVVIANVGLRYLDPALVTFLNFASNRLTGPTVAGTISSTTPLFAVLGAILFLGEPLSPAAAAGTAAIVLGVVALTARGADRPRPWAAWVILLPLAGAAVRGGAQAAVKGGLALWP